MPKRILRLLPPLLLAFTYLGCGASAPEGLSLGSAAAPVVQEPEPFVDLYKLTNSSTHLSRNSMKSIPRPLR